MAFVFFVLSKVLDVLLSPLTWAMGCILAGLVRLPRRLRQAAPSSAKAPAGRRQRARRAAPIVGLAVLYVFSIEPTATFFVNAVESDAVDTHDPAKVYDAVVVLGGLVNEPATRAHRQVAYNESVERLLTAYDLVREGKARVAVLSAGPEDDAHPETTEARVLARQLVRWGVDEGRIVLEVRSRNTRENATETARLVRERGLGSLVLVTSAFHMPRAAGCFRAAGLTVDMLPVDYGGAPFAWSLGAFLPRAGHLATSTESMRELFGRVVYRVRGYSL